MHLFVRDLLRAEQTNIPLQTTEQLPRNPAEADKLQFEFTDALGGHGGWKMTPWSSPETMLASPVPKAWIHRSPADLRPAAGSRLEVEFALIWQEGAWQVCLAFEFLRSRLAGPDWPALARRADLLSAGGIVAGNARALSELPAGEGTLILRHNGANCAAVKTNFDPDALINAASWLTQHAAAQDRPLLSGTTIITSARIGPLPLEHGTYTASWQGLDDIELTV